MARGHHGSPPESSSLPKVEFEIIHDEKLKLPGGVHENWAKAFGYNDFSHFHRPDHYIRHIEPLESDLAKTVEYDMDEQDQDWLDAVNIDRKKGGVDTIGPETFEIIMDRLEKEWFDLTKNIPKPDFAMPSEDSTCAICDDSEGENSNAIVFCDGCNLAVHQDCYGVPYIPEGQWLCRKCTVSPEIPVSCYLCPNEGGAFKQTTHGEWVHLLCAIWIPETRVANEVFMEPVTGVERISKQRWKLRCSICEIREGACIQCTKPSCFVAFHATCARKEKLLMPMKSAHGAEPASLTCFCDRHLPPEQQEIRAAALEGEEKHERSGLNASKSARAYAKTYKPGPPLVPAIIVKRIMEYTNRIKIRKKQDFIHQMCRYWSLKREARRGAPLLKRLHLEPWTASASAKVLSEEDKLMRLDQLKRLRHDLINLRTLTDMCRRREIRKQRRTEVIYEVLSQGLFPAHVLLRNAFEQIQGLDRNDHFKNPVSKNDVPDYFDVVKNPMCWSVIDLKLDHHKYWNLKEFRDDMELVLNNAILYNKSGTVFHKAAMKIRKESKHILDALESSKYVHDPSSWSHMPTAPKVEGEPPDVDVPPPIGDLEPPVNILELLLSSDAIKEDLNMELDGDPVTALANYAFAKVKPPPLNPPSPPPATAPSRERVRKSKPKRDRKAEAERARANKDAREAAEAAARASLPTEEDYETSEDAERKRKDRELQAALDASASFRAPRTRGGIAAAAAFEAEAHGTSSLSSGPSQAPELLSEGSNTDKSRKRLSVAPQLSVMPQLVDHVGNRDSFQMFNAGWILPPDQKRGGRVATERPALPPPRKRQKTDHGSSRLSIVSTAPSESYPALRTPLYSSDPPEMKHNPDESMEMPMDVDIQNGDEPSEFWHPQPESVSRAVSLVGDEDLGGPHNVVTQPNGVVVIEKLDTPAIRRERNLRKKAEKQKQAARAVNDATVSAASSNPSVKQPSSPQPRPSAEPSTSALLPPEVKGNALPSGADDNAGGRREPEQDFGSELSDLSDESGLEDGEEAQDQSAPLVASQPPVAPRLKPTNSVRPKRTPKVEQFDDGTIVWAKSDSFPWWPAVVHADTSTNVPPNILQDHKEKRQRKKLKLYIVQFYDKQASWQSVARDKLQLLGEDKKLDDDMLNFNSKQKRKSASSKQALREAYETALAEIDMDSSTDQPDQSRRGDNDDEDNNVTEAQSTKVVIV